MDNKFWLLGIHRNIIADGHATGGQYDFIEGVALPGAKTPPHIHQDYVETEHVLEGELTIYMENETVVLQPGHGYTIPKGTPHSLHASASIPTKTITVFSPAGFAEVIRKAGLAGELADGMPYEKTDMVLFGKLSTEIGDVTLDPSALLP